MVSKMQEDKKYNEDNYESFRNNEEQKLELDLVSDDFSDISSSSVESIRNYDYISDAHRPDTLDDSSFTELYLENTQQRRGSGDHSTGMMSGAVMICNRPELSPSLSGSRQSSVRQKLESLAKGPQRSYMGLKNNYQQPLSRPSRGFQAMYLEDNDSEFVNSGSSATLRHFYGQAGSWLRLKPQENVNLSIEKNSVTSSKERYSILSSIITPSAESQLNEDIQMTDSNVLQDMTDMKLGMKIDLIEDENDLSHHQTNVSCNFKTFNHNDVTVLEQAKEITQKDLESQVDPVADLSAAPIPSFVLSSCGNRSVGIDSSEGFPSNAPSSLDVHWASPLSKFDRYSCGVDRTQSDRAIEIPILSFQRPHMRGFHFAWISFFVAFFTWFAIAPLLKEIKQSLGLNHEQIWLSNVLSSTATIFCRLFVGPMCDVFGARWVMASILIISAIPVMLTGLVSNATELYILRFFTGIAGASFVTCQYWTTSMFTREISGTANSLVAGWGNLGGAFAQVVMGSALFPLLKLVYGGFGGSQKESLDAADKAWRVAFVVPAAMSLVMAVIVIKYSDDSPKGNLIKMRRLGLIPRSQVTVKMKEAARNSNTWLLAVHYGCCFGVEVTMTAGAALFFSEMFLLSTESSAAIASIFGWLNLFARGFGGLISDIMNVNFGMRGRLLWQVITLVGEGILIVAFSFTKTLGGAIATMVLFSLFVQSAEVSH